MSSVKVIVSEEIHMMFYEILLERTMIIICAYH